MKTSKTTPSEPTGIRHTKDFDTHQSAWWVEVNGGGEETYEQHLEMFVRNINYILEYVFKYVDGEGFYTQASNMEDALKGLLRQYKSLMYNAKKSKGMINVS